MLSAWEGIPSLDRVSQKVMDDNCFSEGDSVDRMGNSLILEKRPERPSTRSIFAHTEAFLLCGNTGEVSRTVEIEKDFVLSS